MYTCLVSLLRMRGVIEERKSRTLERVIVLKSTKSKESVWSVVECGSRVCACDTFKQIYFSFSSQTPPMCFFHTTIFCFPSLFINFCVSDRFSFPTVVTVNPQPSTTFFPMYINKNILKYLEKRVLVFTDEEKGKLFRTHKKMKTCLSHPL